MGGDTMSDRSFDFQREMADWQRRQQQTAPPVPGALPYHCSKCGTFVHGPMPCPKCQRDDEVLALRERLKRAESERDTAREECERLKASVSDLMRSQDSLADERDSLTEELKEFRRNGWHEDSKVAVVRLKRELEEERARHRDYVEQLESGKVVCYGGSKGYFYVKRTGPQPQPKENLMRRLARTTWRWVIIPGLLLSSAAHVVPLSRVYEAARFESRGAFHEFQVCAKCSASRAGGAVCPACGSRESSSLVGREVTTRLLGVWKTGTRWTAEGPVGQIGVVAEAGK